MFVQSDTEIKQLTVDGTVYEVDPPLPPGSYNINLNFNVNDDLLGDMVTTYKKSGSEIIN